MFGRARSPRDEQALLLDPVKQGQVAKVEHFLEKSWPTATN